MPVQKHKVLAYITAGDRLLLLRHPDAPEAGIQVPAGTVEPGETAEAAVLREAYEETGLPGLVLERLLGAQIRDMADFGRDEIHHRYFYHLRYEGASPLAGWEHYERDPSDGSGTPSRFAFFWADLPHGVPPLIADHGRLLPQLLASRDRERQ